MPDMLKHDHEHVPYFPTKNCWRSSSSRYGSQFLNRTYCVVPRWKWTKLRGLTLPSVTSYWCSAGFYLTVFEYWTPVGNHSKGPEYWTTIFSANLRGALDRADDARTL